MPHMNEREARVTHEFEDWTTAARSRRSFLFTFFFLYIFSSPFERCFSDNNIIECKQKNCQSFVYFMDISLKTYPAGDGKDKFNMCEINSSRSCGQIFSHLHILCCFSRSLLSVIFAYNFFSTTHVSSSFVFSSLRSTCYVWIYPNEHECRRVAFDVKVVKRRENWVWSLGHFTYEW